MINQAFPQVEVGNNFRPGLTWVKRHSLICQFLPDEISLADTGITG